MVLNRSAAASPPCSTSEVCFASRRPRIAAASPHGRAPFGGRPLGAAVSVPRGWRVFETQRWRAQSRRQKLRRRALKGAASEKGKSHAAAFSMPKSPLPGRYYNRRARSFRGEPPPPRGSNGRSLARDPPDSSCGGSAVASRCGLLRRPQFPWIACGNLENSRPWDFLGRFSGLTRPEKTPSQPFRKSQGR